MRVDQVHRGEILEAARSATLSAREETHGDCETQMAYTATLWSAFLGIDITPAKVAHMMVLLKMSRARFNGTHADHFIDMCGYASIAGQLALKQEESNFWNTGSDLAPVQNAEIAKKTLAEEFGCDGRTHFTRGDGFYFEVGFDVTLRVSDPKEAKTIYRIQGFRGEDKPGETFTEVVLLSENFIPSVVMPSLIKEVIA